VKLDALGFAWELSATVRNWNDAGWEAQLAKLAAYKQKHGDSNMPQGWAEDPRLGNWVMTQKVLKRKLDRGEPSDDMNAARVARLEALGFVWDEGGRPGRATGAKGATGPAEPEKFVVQRILRRRLTASGMPQYHTRCGRGTRRRRRRGSRRRALPAARSCWTPSSRVRPGNMKSRKINLHFLWTTPGRSDREKRFLYIS
jgi:hypothetical protein